MTGAFRGFSVVRTTVVAMARVGGGGAWLAVAVPRRFVAPLDGALARPARPGRARFTVGGDVTREDRRKGGALVNGWAGWRGRGARGAD